MSGYNLREPAKRKKYLDYEAPFLKAKSKWPQLKSVNHPKSHAKRSAQPPPVTSIQAPVAPLVTPTTSSFAATLRPPATAMSTTANMAPMDDKLDQILSNFQRFKTRITNCT